MNKALKNRLARRLKIIGGQVRGLEKMIEEGQYCIDVINQASAIRHALSSIEDLMLENHLSTHAVEQVRGGAHDRAIREILSVYKVAKNK